MFRKVLLVFVFIGVFLFLFLRWSFAADTPHFVSFVNPVRGLDGWSNEKQGPLDLPRFQYKLAGENQFPVTWLLRFDAVSDASISGFFKTIIATDSSQTVGAFLEITPSLTAAAGVQYSPGEYQSAANRIFLSGYDQSDRIKLIDAYMSQFYSVFGYYPQVVGAWHIDSFSLEYLQKHYSVIAGVICDEQYTTDNYRLWGGYLGSPYFPSKLNFLVPATTRENRVDLALTKWAIRDPFNFYGEGAVSNYSLQVNDYPYTGQDSRFFEKLVGIYAQQGFNEFSQINIGLENDYPLASYQADLTKTYSILKKDAVALNLRFISLADFGQWLKTRYTYTNPAYFYKTQDVSAKKPGTVFWYQNPFYRLALKSVDGQTEILDFRLYNQKEAEAYYLTRNIDRKLYAETNALIDSVKYPGTTVKLDLDLEKAQISYSGWQVIFKNGDRELRLAPEKISFTGFTAPVLTTDELKVQKSPAVTVWQIAPKLPFTTGTLKNIFVLALILAVALFTFCKAKKYRLVLTFGWLFSAVTLATVWQSGFVFPYGLGLWGPNGHDAIFHLSLSEHFKQNLLSLMHPQLSGQLLKNYHFGFDWISGLISKVTGLTTVDLYFRYLPLLLVIALTPALVKLLYSWRFNKFQTVLSLFFAYLCGSAGFIAALFLHRGFTTGESVFWANQSTSLMLNPPFAFSLLFLVLFLIVYENNTQKPWRLVTLIILGGLLAQIKIYAFILLAFALLIKREFKLLIGVSLLGGLLLLPSLSLNGSPFTFNPLWFTRSMFESTDRLYWPRLAQAWQTYENGGAFLKLIGVNLFALIVFLLGNLWLRLLGLCKLRRPLVGTIVVFGIIIPLLFTQKVNPWNTIQFMYYSLFFLGIAAGEQLGSLIGRLKPVLIYPLIVIVMLASLPTTVGTLKDYFTGQSSSRLSLIELRALDLLRTHPRGIVVSPLTYSRYLPLIPDPKPLYVYASTAYISAFSGDPEYISDTINLDITGFSYNDRTRDILRLYRTRDAAWVKEFFDTNHIRYLYETPFDKIQFRPEDACLKRIFDSGEVNIYQYGCQYK